MKVSSITELMMILFLLPNIESLGYWRQKGHWMQQTYSNNSFLFSFLGVDSGPAIIKGSQGSALLTVQLAENQDRYCKKITFSIWMQSKKYPTDQIFQIKTFIDISFDVGEKQITFGQQEMRIKRQLMFNVTLNNRKELQLKTVEGVFTVDLVENETISPYIYLQLWFILIIITVVFQSMALRIQKLNNNPVFKELLGAWSTFILACWLIRFSFEILNQSFYFRPSAKVQILTLTSIFIFVSLCLELLAFLIILSNIFKNSLSNTQQIFSMFIYLLGSILTVPQSQLKLWHCLAVVLIFEIWQLSWVKGRINNNNPSKLSQIKYLAALYIFPCAIFPMASFQINYPKNQKQMWWLYAILFFVEVAIFLLKSNGGITVNFNKIMFVMKRFLNKLEYEKLQNKLCPLCFKEIEPVESQVNAAGQVQQTDWIQNSCKHYFHKECLQENIYFTDKCFFDQTKWNAQIKEHLQD